MSMPSGLDSVLRALGSSGMDLSKANLSKGVSLKADAKQAPDSKDGVKFERILDQRAENASAPVDEDDQIAHNEDIDQDHQEDGPSEDDTTAEATDGRELVAMAEVPANQNPQVLDESKEAPNEIEAALVRLALKMDEPKVPAKEMPALPTENAKSADVDLKGLELNSKDWETLQAPEELNDAADILQNNVAVEKEIQSAALSKAPEAHEVVSSDVKMEPSEKAIEPKLDLHSGVGHVPEAKADSGSSKNLGQESSDRGLPKQDLKHFADSLMIHSRLNVEAPQSFQNELVKVQASDVTDATVVKSHVMNELQPLISKVLLNNEGGEMTIQLRPGHLGQMKVDISIIGDSVKVNMAAEKIESQSILQSQVGELKQQLQNSGLKVEQVSVGSLNPSGQSANMRQEQEADSRHQNPEQSREHGQRQNHQSSKNAQGRDVEGFWSRLANETEEAA